MRLNKWLVVAGAVPGRRQADALITNGRVSLNGNPATLGMQVDEHAIVVVDGKRLKLRADHPQLIRFYKPIGVISSHRKQGKSRVVFDLLPKDFADFIIVGRLDKESEGLMLLTNDGQLAHQLMHPSYKVERTYVVRVNRRVDSTLVGQLLAGVMLDDGMSTFLSCTIIGDQAIEVTLTEGRNRQIRRTLQQLGYRVEKLVRLEHGPYTLLGLRPGEWSEVEIGS